jgi:hypothetical protein
MLDEGAGSILLDPDGLDRQVKLPGRKTST